MATRRKRATVATTVLVGLLPATALPAGSATAAGGAFDAAVEAVLDLPYDPTYAPSGPDAAFGATDYPAAFPLTDTSTGTCCLGPVPDQPPLADLAPPFPAFPDGFDLVALTSFDGTPLHAFAAIRDGAPGVVVMHGFNTNGKYSVVRYAAALWANGFSVIAPDHRDMGREWERGGSWHPEGRRGQSLGWKESEDLLVAARYLRDAGSPRIGALGFSEGAQNTILAAGKDLEGLLDAVLTFSGPADQTTLAARSPATTAALMTTVVNNPDLCGYLEEVGEYDEFAASANFILRHDSAVATLDGDIGFGVDPTAPGLHLYATDDTLVPDWNATMLASRTNAMPRQHTVLVEAGNHAYFYDRWWTQAAALTWFGHWLDPDGVTSAEPTVAAPAGGAPLREQSIDLSGVDRADGDAERTDSPLCPPADEPIGPTVLLDARVDDATVIIDARRSYSGWDDHEIARWEITFGDGASAGGRSLAEGRVEHAYSAAGRYEITVTVTDDTGRQASATQTVEVAGESAAPAAPSPTPSDAPTVPATPTTPPASPATAPLPATGGAGLWALLGIAAVAGAVRASRPR